MDHSGGILPCWNIMSSNQWTGTCLFQVLALVLGVFVKQIKLVWNYKVQSMLILPVVHQLVILMGEKFPGPNLAFSHNVTHSGSSRCHIVLAQCLSVLRNLGGSVLNQWLFQVYLFENGFLPHSHLIDSLARQKISAEMSFQTCML